MKKLKTPIIIMIAFSILIYLLISFVNCNIDFTKWEMISRVLFAGIVIIVIPFSLINTD